MLTLMAPKLASLATLFLLLAIVGAHASIYRTTITTIEEEVKMSAANNEKCEHEMQFHPITACRQFLKHGSSGTLLMLPSNTPQRPMPQECCKQLQQVSNPCQCEMVKMMLEKLMQQEGGGTSMEQCKGQCAEMMMRGAFLPQMCNVGPPCRFGSGDGGSY